MVLKIVLVVLAVIFILPLLRKLGKKKEPPANASTPRDVRNDEAEEDAEAERSRAALAGTVVLLEGNDWGACTVDGITEEWSRFAPGPRGFSNVPAGRHRVTTRIDGAEAVLDFVLYPGEIFLRRLDRDRARWAELADEDAERVRRSAEGGEKGALSEALIRYVTTMGIARVQAGKKVVSPDAALARASAALANLADDATSAEEELLPRAKNVGLDLVGVPLTRAQLDALVEGVTARIDDAAGGGRRERAARIARVGLAALPGEATLVERLAKVAG